MTPAAGAIENEALLRQVREWCPEVAIRQVQYGGDGMNNRAVIINGELVFRFPVSEFARKRLAEEVAILDSLAGRFEVQVPVPFLRRPEAIGYRMILGAPMRRDVLRRLPAELLALNAKRVAIFLKGLHEVPVENIARSSNRFPRQFIAEMAGQVQKEIFPHVRPYVRQWAKNLFETFLGDAKNFEFEPRVIHGDLFPDHLLFNKAENAVGGVIDFGLAGVGDPAVDLATLMYNYGETFTERMWEFYPELQAASGRARLFAETFDVQLALSALKRNDAASRVSHLGSAKDLRAW